jgi:hypothetical protein
MREHDIVNRSGPKRGTRLDIKVTSYQAEIAEVHRTVNDPLIRRIAHCLLELVKAFLFSFLLSPRLPGSRPIGDGLSRRKMLRII